MAKKKVMLTFPPELVREPIIYQLGKNFNLVTNIRRADVTEDRGWVVLELEGSQNDIGKALEWINQKGIRVDPISGDVVEG